MKQIDIDGLRESCKRRDEIITRLKAELDRKDEALREIAGMVNNGDFGTTSGMVVSGTVYEAVGIAIKALQNKEWSDVC